MTREAQEIVERLQEVEAHLEELRDAWQRGALASYDSQNGARSNRNMEVLISLRSSIAPVAELIDAAENGLITLEDCNVPAANALRAALTALRDAAGHSK